MGRVLGVDLGARRIGLALSDPTGLIASPLRVLERSGDPAADRQAIVAAARERGGRDRRDRPAQGDVGTARGRGDRGQPPRSTRSATLAPDLTFELVDERLTTVIAQRSLIEAGMTRRKRKGTVDKVAAAVILQSYLDAHR